jgi:CheY-like chemotaxis protein/anti-sigma regulatory factor (Ser/Thr protein kinase)
LVAAGGHKLVIDLPDEPLHVEGDMIRLTQVLSNLINNAAKYTARAGEIFVCAKRDEASIIVSVRDNGVGIPRAMLGEVFTMFTQINRHLGRSQGGLGIGLGLVKRLVEMHGGTVAANSEGENRGAEFVVRLPPATKTASAAGETLLKQHGPLRSRKVLVVDDNRDAAESLGRLLVICGHEVHTVNNGHDALKVVAEFCPAMVILDLGMPGIDGFETARRLRKSSGGEDLFLVALSGWGQDQDRSRTKAAGFDFHLVKPIDAAAVQRLLHIAELEPPLQN